MAGGTDRRGFFARSLAALAAAVGGHLYTTKAPAAPPVELPWTDEHRRQVRQALERAAAEPPFMPCTVVNDSHGNSWIELRNGRCEFLWPPETP